jgi:hypothetical protein
LHAPRPLVDPAVDSPLLPCLAVARANRRLGWWRRRGSRPALPARPGSPAVSELSGTTPSGAPLQVGLGSGRTILLFLTSSCYGCQPLWDSLRTGATLDGAALVLVTPSLTTGSSRDVAALAPDGAEVLMSSEAWHAFGITAAPWFVVVAGGVVRTEGAAPPAWDEVRARVGPTRA